MVAGIVGQTLNEYICLAFVSGELVGSGSNHLLTHEIMLLHAAVI